MEVLAFVLGCQCFWQAVEVYLIGRLRFQAGVWPSGVVEVDVAADRLPGLVDRGVSMQVNLFVLDLAPDPFDEDVIAPAPLAVHADPDPFFS